MTFIDSYVGDEDEGGFFALETFIGVMAATALTIFVLGGAPLSPHAAPELAAFESLTGP